MLFLQPAILRPAGKERFATRRPHLDKGALHKILHNHCVPPAAEVGGDELLKRREAGVSVASEKGSRERRKMARSGPSSRSSWFGQFARNGRSLRVFDY